MIRLLHPPGPTLRIIVRATYLPTGSAWPSAASSTTSQDTPIFNVHQQISRATQDRQAATPVPPSPPGRLLQQTPLASLDPQKSDHKRCEPGVAVNVRNDLVKLSGHWLCVFFFHSSQRPRGHSFSHWRTAEGIQSYPSLTMAPPVPGTPPLPHLPTSFSIALNFQLATCPSGLLPHCFIDATTTATATTNQP